MIKACLCSIGMFSALLFAAPETVALSGTVQDAEGMGIAGVKISLTVKSDLSTETVSDGTFSLVGGTSVLNNRNQNGSVAFTFRKNMVVFTPAAGRITGSMAVYSGNGKRVACAQLNNCSAEERRIALPELSSGIYFLKIAVNGEVFTRSMVCTGSELFLKNGNVSERAPFRLAKKSEAAPVDTIVAEKEGYTTAKTAIAGYTQENIDITLEPEGGTGGECTRESMKAIVDKYIEAQEAGDPSLMPLTADVKVIENTEDISVDESILKRALNIDLHRSIYDVDSCRTFTEIIVATTEPTTVMGTRLRIANGEITEIEAITTEEGGWGYNADNYLEYSQQEEGQWYILPEDEQPTREFLIDAGNQYFDMFNGDFDDIPWGAPCYRIEGGMVTYGGDPDADYCVTTSLGSNTVLVTGRDFIVDVEMGSVNVFAKLCALDSHLFRLVDGHFRFVHTLNYGCNM